MAWEEGLIIGFILVGVVVGSLIAGAIEIWLERRKQEKNAVDTEKTNQYGG